jgi:hypothetical protein
MQRVIIRIFVSCLILLLSNGTWHSRAEAHSTDSDSASYPFVRGDAVRITVYPDTALFVNGTYHIDDGGYVLLPILGRMRIDTLTEKQFESFLDTAYLRYLRYPAIQAQPLIRLTFLGGFQKPGLYYLSPHASLWEAVAVAGGPIREDGLKKMKWERQGKVLRTGLVPALEAGTSLALFGMKSGDQIWVTHVPKRDGWDIFIGDVLPVVSISISAATAAGTLYFAYQVNRAGK